MNKEKFYSFEKLIHLLCITTPKKYVFTIGTLIIIGAICNYSSNKSLPWFWVLVCGFALVIYMDIHSVRKSGVFLEQLETGDYILRDNKTKLTRQFYSGRNWIIIFLVPTLIVPAVIYIIKYPLGLPIKIFAYLMLYIIIMLCVVSYSEYVYLIMFSFRLYKKADKIRKYDKDRPHKTDWITALADITNKQSNYFFITGTNFILLLSLITLSGQYGVSLENRTSLMLVCYLWMLIAIGIVVMFTVFSLCSYLFIKLLIEQLTQMSIAKYEHRCKCMYSKKEWQKYGWIFEINKIKILLLEQTPSYPYKPLIRYAVSCAVGIFNFGATLESIYSLQNQIMVYINSHQSSLLLLTEIIESTKW